MGRPASRQTQQIAAAAAGAVAALTGAGDASSSPAPANASPLFSVEDTPGELAKIAVLRDQPIDEGFIGWLAPDASEEEISRRWGGGKYRLQGRTERGQSIKGAFRTIEIGGDPKFESRTSLVKWQRLQAQEAGELGGHHQQQQHGISVLELIQLQTTRDEAARKEAREAAERRAQEAEKAHQREMERLRLEMAAREGERKADQERRDREAREAEERRRRDADEARGRDREFFAAMLKMQESRPAAPGLGVEQIVSLLGMARELFGGGEGAAGDPITALMANLPAILDKSAGIASQIQGGQPAAQASAELETNDGEAVTLTGAHAKALNQVVEHLRGQGIDPNVALMRALGALRKVRRPPAAIAAQGQPPAPAEGAPAAPAARARAAPRKVKRGARAAARAPRARAAARRAKR